MGVLYVTQEDSLIKTELDRLIIVHEGKKLQDIPLVRIDAVVIMGRVGITSGAVRVLMENRIPVSYLSNTGRPLGRLDPVPNKNNLLRRLQYKLSDDSSGTLNIAREMIRGKITNQRAVLRSKEVGGESEETKKVRVRLKELAVSLDGVDNLDRLRGVEGEAASLYYSVFDSRIKKKEFSFPGRAKRPPTDPVNSLLSFAYTLLMNDLFGAVFAVGFDPYIGFLHADRYGRPSLALDLMEEFRPLVADAVVLSLINRGELTISDFEEVLGKTWYLKREGKKTFLRAYENKKHQAFRHPFFGKRTTYCQSFLDQAVILAKAVRGEISKYVPLTMR